ncbi:hypothetical protein G4D82_00545 [Flavobacterium sp. CYK-4]|uniref:hypothetical protein n=1 Tax=Flavobacterium lotistagni TaxID=2709660 RepID=UPI00140B2CCB|nr:hypothetical protein [Flavobacterium lotistagni]NHM05697.1 hypothetical protein [Flavobacterium lotistagni]
MRKLNLLIVCLTVTLFFSCKNDEVAPAIPAVKDHSNNLNISILLDLSDRISPRKYPNKSMEYYLRDVGYISSVAEAFTNHLRNKKVRQVNDKMQLFFDPAPLNPEINALSKALKIAVDKNNVSKEFIDKIKKTYASEPLKIYQLAIDDDYYIGSDTWKFFQNKVNDYCIENNYRNILIVLTDGYIYYKDSKIKENNATTYLTPEVIRTNGLNTSDWSQKMRSQKLEFIKANNDLSDLEVLVLGIHPDPKNPYEEEVIKAYWGNWFKAMKVKRYEIRNADIPSNMDQLIQNFVSKNNLN